MITYDVNLCIGIDSIGKKAVIKCHDTGVNLRVWLSVLKKKTWREETEPYIIPDGSTAVLKIAKPDKTFVLIDGEITGGYIFFEELPHQTFTAVGIAKSEVSLFDANGRRLTTATFEIDVPEECVCDCKEESKPYVDIMSKQIQAAIDAEANAKAHAEAAEAAAERAENAAEPDNIEAIQEAIDDALKKAKESGEFDGKDGVSPTISIGEVETGEPNSEAKVIQSGTSTNVVLNFSIPRGAQGIQGIPGTPGRDGIDGSPGKDGKDGVDGKDGYTPVKGVDYFDGQNGTDGKDGKDGTDASVTTENITKALGYTPVNGSGGTAGQFAVSDGNGGIAWLSLTNVGEVGA